MPKGSQKAFNLGGLHATTPSPRRISHTPAPPRRVVLGGSRATPRVTERALTPPRAPSPRSRALASPPSRVRDARRPRAPLAKERAPPARSRERVVRLGRRRARAAGGRGRALLRARHGRDGPRRRRRRRRGRTGGRRHRAPRARSARSAPPAVRAQAPRRLLRGRVRGVRRPRPRRDRAYHALATEGTLASDVDTVAHELGRFGSSGTSTPSRSRCRTGPHPAPPTTRRRRFRRFVGV